MIDFSKLLPVWYHEPMKMKEALWPHVNFYDKQREIIQSVQDNDETYVPAGNQLGKDFVAGFVILWFFITRYKIDKSRNWVRVITTSVKDEHLDVLWGEIGRYVAGSRFPLSHKQGGPLIVNTHEIRHIAELELTGGNAGNYIKGQVSKQGEGLQGHHAHETLFVADEASGVSDVAYDMASTWAKKMLIIGNPLPCNNFFYKAVKAGDLAA